jgi:hypothetical protein
VASIGLTGIGVAVDVAKSRPLMALFLFFLGIGVGLWDVAMNLEGAAVERLLGRTVMPHFHAAFSGGTVGAALVGALMSWSGVRLVPHLLGAVVVTVLIAAWGLRSFLPRDVDRDTDAGQPDGGDGDAHDDRAGRSDPVGHPPRERQGEHRAHRGGEQGQPQLAGCEPQGRLAVRDPRGEGREGDAGEREGDEDGVASLDRAGGVEGGGRGGGGVAHYGSLGTMQYVGV